MRVVAILMIVVAMAATSAAQTRPPPAAVPVPAPQPAIPPVAKEVDRDSYVLGVGDRLRVIVYGEADLSGEYEIDANGVVSLPLIGVTSAANQTIRGLEAAITKRYDEYLRDPRVNLQVTQYRPFFILGEVKQPGSYAFIPGMSIKNAVAMAGGYTVRGGPRGISIERALMKGKEDSSSEDAQVNPGDIVRVSPRLF
jgi:protein involved in polysaccharide export with SLBB domain